MDVTIDGVKYTPIVEIKHPESDDIREAVECMLRSRCLYNAPHGTRGEIGEWWDVLTLLAGKDVAKLAQDQSRQAWDLYREKDEDI
jgi:hypothetical protein